MTKRMLSILALALAAGALLAGALYTHSAVAGDGHDGEKEKVKYVVKTSEETDGGDHHEMSWEDHFPDADHVKIDDLDLDVGEAATYVTEAGRRVDITRESDEVYVVRVGDAEARFGGETYADGEDVEVDEDVRIEKHSHENVEETDEGEKRIEKRVIKKVQGEPAGEPVVVEIIDEHEEDGKHRIEKRVIVVHVDD